jgi:hypothetical protein
LSKNFFINNNRFVHILKTFINEKKLKEINRNVSYLKDESFKKIIQKFSELEFLSLKNLLEIEEIIFYINTYNSLLLFVILLFSLGNFIIQL